MRAVWYDRQGPADEVLVCGELPTPEGRRRRAESDRWRAAFRCTKPRGPTRLSSVVARSVPSSWSRSAKPADHQSILWANLWEIRRLFFLSFIVQ